MSAFFVGKATVNAAVQLSIFANGPQSLEQATAFGKSLWLMNALALEKRYNTVNASDYLDTINGYQFAPVVDANFHTILKAAAYLLYQCSEADVPQLKIFGLMDAIITRYADHTASDAYAAAPWGLCG
jgi:hypothetical protein